MDLYKLKYGYFYRRPSKYAVLFEILKGLSVPLVAFLIALCISVTQRPLCNMLMAEPVELTAPTVAAIDTPDRVFFVKVTDVYDGDTFTGDIDLGLGLILVKQKFRLEGINTPEVTGATKEEGFVERDKLRQQITNCNIIVKISGKCKYGRWLTKIVGKCK